MQEYIKTYTLAICVKLVGPFIIRTTILKIVTERKSGRIKRNAIH